ncbi:MAG: hypothetical protein WC565_06165 [Parcubacteria group bacterium]|jgi:hypothetical protein
MALVKQNPLPVGRYWVDILQKHVPDFNDFARIMNRGIHIEQTKEHLDASGGGVTSYLFVNKNPLVPWDHTKYGWPNDATGITDLDQTGQVPDPAPLFGDLGIGDLTLPLFLLAALWLLSLG